MARSEDALAEFIRRQTGAEAAKVLQFERLSGGAIQDNFALSVKLSAVRIRAGSMSWCAATRLPALPPA